MALFTAKEIQLIKEQAAQAEEEKSLSPGVADILYRHRLFKLFVPDKLGGRMTPLPNALQLFEECAYIEGNVGWLVTIGSGGNYFAGYYDKTTAARLFSPASAVLAGSGYPGMAKKAKGGYFVSGEWKFCSGAGYATFYTATAIIQNKKGKEEKLAFTFMPEQVKVIKDWNAFGLKATESHSIRVKNAFVPDALVFDLTKLVSFKKEKIYSFPFLQFAQLSFAAVVAGLCRAFMDEAAKLAKSPHYKANKMRFAYLKNLIAEEKENFAGQTGAFYEVAQRSWDDHCKNILTPELLNDVSLACQKVSAEASRIAGSLFPNLGMAVAMENTAINKIYRDLLTANQHILLKPFLA